MRISSIDLRAFKRFTAVTVGPIPNSARLVVLLGPNGAGKSSLLEGINTWRRLYGYGSGSDPSNAGYYWKGLFDSDEAHRPGENLEIQFHDRENLTAGEIRSSLVVRSAFRNEGNVDRNNMMGYIDPNHDQGLYKVVDNDPVATRNLKRIMEFWVNGISEGDFDLMSGKDIRESLVFDVQRVLDRVIPGLRFIGPVNPLTDGTFHFQRDTGPTFSYQNLSAGEKSAVDLILDLALRARQSSELIYCVDEPDAHLNPKVHGDFLHGLYDLLPQNGQLWIATHSTGMLNVARELHLSNPHEIVFLSFYDKNYDDAVVMEPTSINRRLWSTLLDDSLGDIALLVGPKRLVLCEGKPASKRGKAAFDQQCYDRIFSDQYPDSAFLSVGNVDEVGEDKLEFGPAVITLIEGVEIVKLIDRDDRSSEEISESEANGVTVLPRRNLESYLLDDEILEKLCKTLGKIDKLETLLQQKNNLLQQSGKPVDDFKAVSGQLYVEVKKLLDLRQRGNTADTFMRDTLAPLITPETKVYRELESTIFGPN